MLRTGRWKARFGLLSAFAVVAPAAGLAYLGVKSNLAERDRARQSFFALNRKEARFIAGELDDEAQRTLDQVAQLFADAPGALPALEGARRVTAELPLAEHVFYIDAGGRLVWPPETPIPGLASSPRAPSRRARAAPPAPERDLMAYAVHLGKERERARQLSDARAAEAGRADADARRAYLALSRGEGDSAAQALLGLGRLELTAGRRAEAAARYAELRRRFGALRDAEGISYALLADLGEARATGDPHAALRVYRGLLDAAYAAPPAALVAFTAGTRGRLDPGALGPEAAAELHALDARAEASRREAAFAAAIAADAPDLARSAGPEPQARRAVGLAATRLVYRRHADGGVVGFAVGEAALQKLAERALDREVSGRALPPGTRVELGHLPADPEAPGLLASETPRLFSGLAVALWGDTGAADRAARAQLFRYLGLVGGLIALMVVGVVATYRGAARERELGKLKSDFVSTVSHELKTPLTSIRMFAEMLREGVAAGDDERTRRYHDVIVRESERLGRLIANVLDFSQIERGARRYELRPVSAPALATEAVETFRRLADGDGHEIVLAIAEEAAGVAVNVDREALVQSLLNLLSNAAKYGGREAPVTVRLTADAAGGPVRIAVIDRGPGIAPGELKRLFREFYRSPEARRSGVEGTGLGLALVKRHVEAHGGHVNVESAPGRGATFTIVLPRAEGTPG